MGGFREWVGSLKIVNPIPRSRVMHLSAREVLLIENARALQAKFIPEEPAITSSTQIKSRDVIEASLTRALQNANSDVVFLSGEIKRITHERDSLLKVMDVTGATRADDPEMDGTDYAHPAWWRGNERGTEATVEILGRAAAGQPLSGAFNYQPLTDLYKTILGLTRGSQGPSTSSEPPYQGDGI